MKQLLIAIFIFLSIISTFLVADGNRDPSFEFSYNSSEIQVGEGSVGSFYGTIHNVSSGAITIVIVRRVNDLPDNWTSSVCLGSICYNESIDSVSVQIAGGDSSTCSLLAWTNGTGTGTVQLDIFAIESNDHSIVDVNFYAGTVGLDENQFHPKHITLYQNYPNPFNPITTIHYDLPEDALVSINIYDLMGRNIRSLVNTNQSAGYRSIRWDATNNLGEPVSAGMYIYTIQAGKFRQTKKMVLLK